MRTIYFLPLFLLMACGSDQEKTNTTGETTSAENTLQDTVVETAAPTIQIVRQPSLLGNLTKRQQDITLLLMEETSAISFLSAMKTAEKAETEQDLYTVFHYIDSTCTFLTNRFDKDNASIYEKIDSLMTLFKEISDVFPYLHFTCEAECTMMRFMPRYDTFAQLAQKTKGTHDDDFFDWWKMIFGEFNSDSPMHSIWFSMTWDYGGNSMLGSGNHYKVLKRSQEIKPGNPFIKEITAMENNCLEDAATWNTLYYTTEKAIGEVKKIMTLDIGIQNKKTLQQRIERLISPDKDMQVDCEHRDCIYG